jgi:hypothetical protein
VPVDETADEVADTEPAESEEDSFIIDGETGAGPIVVIYQCPDDVDPTEGNVSACDVVHVPEAVLIRAGTDIAYTLEDAPIIDEENAVYYWDELPVGTYLVNAGLPGEQFAMVQLSGTDPPVPSADRTFSVAAGGSLFLVQVYVYGTSAYISGETAGGDPTDVPGDSGDSDGDGLLDEDESFFYGTDPTNADSDDDGTSDGEEVFASTNPLQPEGESDSGNQDSDGDGLYDEDETGYYLTDPFNPDSDGDGDGDGLEVFNGTDPLNP